MCCLKHKMSLEVLPKELCGIIQGCLQQRIRYWSCFTDLWISFFLGDTMVWCFFFQNKLYHFQIYCFGFQLQKLKVISLQFEPVSVLMRSIREDIEKEHPSIQKSDVAVFFQVAEFVTSFQCYKYSASKVRMIIWELQIFWHTFLFSSFKLKYLTLALD